MANDTAGEGREALDGARQMIARQSEEIATLRRRLEEESAAGELRRVFTQAAAAGAIAAPVSHARQLERIVETAVAVISAHAGALLLVDDERQELAFEVVCGGAGETLKQYRLPLGHGIAGLVAVCGQPMAVADAQNDPRTATEIAEAVDYQPRSILCVPLLSHDQVIGVLELLDKKGAPSFSTTDMEALGRFGSLAAEALEQSRTHCDLAALLTEMLHPAAASPGAAPAGGAEHLGAFAAGLEEDATYRQALELARLVQEIVGQGEREAEACRAILRGFAEYLRSGSERMGGIGAWG